MTSQPFDPDSNESKGREEERASPDPKKLDRAARQSERNLRAFAKDMRRYAAGGVVYQASKHIFQEIVDHLTQN